jgi:hypothetical protein
MARTLEAVIDINGRLRLLGPVHVDSARWALVTVLDEDPTSQPMSAPGLSEPVLAEDWERPEEVAAWSHLKPARSYCCHFRSVIYRNQGCGQPLSWPMPGAAIECCVR